MRRCVPHARERSIVSPPRYQPRRWRQACADLFASVPGRAIQQRHRTLKARASSAHRRSSQGDSDAVGSVLVPVSHWRGPLKESDNLLRRHRPDQEAPQLWSGVERVPGCDKEQCSADWTVLPLAAPTPSRVSRAVELPRAIGQRTTAASGRPAPRSAASRPECRLDWKIQMGAAFGGWVAFDRDIKVS